MYIHSVGSRKSTWQDFLGQTSPPLFSNVIESLSTTQHNLNLLFTKMSMIYGKPDILFTTHVLYLYM